MFQYGNKNRSRYVKFCSFNILSAKIKPEKCVYFDLTRDIVVPAKIISIHRRIVYMNLLGDWLT